MAHYTGCCIYCGQLANVVAGEGLTEDEVNKLATLQCNCDEAQALQKVEQKKTYAEANIKQLFENDGAGLKHVLLEACGCLAAQNIKKISITTADGVKATLTAKENSIKCERTVTDKKSLED